MFKIGVMLMTLSATLFGNWFTNLFDPTPTPTIKIPVDLSKAGTIVDMEFRVDYDESTRFSLDFECKDVKLDEGLDCKEMEKFLGLNGYLYGNREKIRVADYARAKRELGNIIDKNYDLDGTRVPLKIILQKVEDNGTFSTVIDKPYDTKGQNGSGRDITVKYLNKGKYRLKVESLKDFKELKQRPIEFRIQSTYRK
jgi:hypothetical protein